MPYANLEVSSFCRRTRRTLAVHATGLTHAAARALVDALRAAPGYDEDAFGYQTRTMSLSAQIAHGEALGLIRAAVDPAPYRLAA